MRVRVKDDKRIKGETTIIVFLSIHSNRKRDENNTLVMVWEKRRKGERETDQGRGTHMSAF